MGHDNSADAHPRSRGVNCPSCARKTSLEKQRAQGKPGAHCTRSLACRLVARECSHHRFTGTPGLPCAMVLTVYFVLSPVTGLFCHRRSQDKPATLTPASGRQDHTTSPSASASFVNAPPKRPPHPAPNVRDDRDTPLLWDGMARVLRVIWVCGEAKYFCPAIWTGQITLIRLTKLVSRRTRFRGPPDRTNQAASRKTIT
jgi:hypothetical protein